VGDHPAELLADAAGFPGCGRCKYVETGSSELCFACARRSMEALAPSDKRCEVCDQPLLNGGHCGNPMCSNSNRQFDWNWAIAMKSGALDRVIRVYKYDGQHGWAKIFGRILLGFMDRPPKSVREFGLIIASPAVAGGFDHAREVLKEAAWEDMFNPETWPFDVEEGSPVMIRTEPVHRFAGKNFQQRLAIAEEQLKKSLKVVDADRIAGRNILVYDDVFTTGITLHTVAGVLKASGASGVCGVSLVRAPFKGLPK
jgi:predicted amidophosphoribosyltransferase